MAAIRVNISAAESGFDELRIACDELTLEATRFIGSQINRKIRSNLNLLSHDKGTPTPSFPGQPPARISGTLRDSIVTGEPRPVGFGEWEIEVGPQGVVYARIQELGGASGPGHHTILPARPYVRPAIDHVYESGIAERAIVRAWTKSTEAAG